MKSPSEAPIDVTQSAACPACGQNSWAADRVASDILAIGSSRRVVECRTCGLKRLWPYLTESELGDLYRGGYFGDDKDSSGLLGVDNPSEAYQAFYVPERVDKFRRIVRRLRAEKPDARTLLDFGAATGAFVAIACEEGLAAEGVEFSAHAVAAAFREYGLTLHQGGVEAVPDRLYDFIVLHHVFEHLTRPLEDLRELTKHLAPGGLLFLEIPFQFHALEKTRFRLFPPTELRTPTLLSFHHPYFYTPRSLKLILERAGLEVPSLRCFVPRDYKTSTIAQRIRKVIWVVLDRVARVGNIIEAIARVPS